MRRVLVRTKCREWAYEKERRMLVDLMTCEEDVGLHFRSFDAKMRLREVILGAKCSEDLLEVRRYASEDPGRHCISSQACMEALQSSSIGILCTLRNGCRGTNAWGDGSPCAPQIARRARPAALGLRFARTASESRVSDGRVPLGITHHAERCDLPCARASAPRQ